jgi:hypothetical protein
MANRKGSRAAVRPKRTMEQSVAAKLDPKIHDPVAQAQYDVATYRSARKNLSVARGVKHRPVAGKA